MTVTAESLFRELFLPLYPEDTRSDLGRARSMDANPANNPTVLAHLDDAAAVFAANAPLTLGMSSEALNLDYSDASVHRLSAALTTAQRDRLMAMGAHGTADNALFNLVVHGASYVGACIVRSHGGRWAVRRPLWESLVYLESHLGQGELPVFHWWLKSLADGAEITLADRYRTHVEVPRSRPEDLPILVAEDRKLPRLKRPRYDAFYKYLRAHLTELRDVGEDFPSPERFEELRFEQLSFLRVGGGRMVLVWGHNDHGLHAFWLGKTGFEKSAFWPCDKFPEPIIRPSGDDKLEVIFSHDGQLRSFELLWWGP
ncbi:MAG: hypothetical protein JWP87_5072 [Labilithrix sp.]|nr:hypothetical protein [Labilithrix sp.]